ncbi:MAG: chemotaxis protein [Nitrosopumilus sp.]|nr:chemotaxis protein [Nitrosopumilus sp.]MDH3735879.1 chemotaxis protein [Nitrosopumilus sp.]MDH3823698.1 chemotaxis protein [Nitrosopumilus sp.]MDH3834189.1 chemotaxis protein [Nitrosopumilus sp.]
MATKITKKKTTAKTKKITKREPSPSVLFKKVASVSDSNKVLQKEIKAMTKIFGENQKVLVSMKGMIDTLSSTLEYIQKQSKQINIIEEDTQKLYAGLSQVRTQSNLVNKINNQTAKLQEEINKISDSQKASVPTGLSQQVEDSMESIKNNSQMIIKIAQRIDEVRDDLRKVSGKTDSFLEIGSEINKLKDSIEEVSGKTTKLETGTQIIESLKQELGKITEGVSSSSTLNDELNAIKVTIDAISSKASKIDSLGGVIDGLKQQFEAVSSKANSVDSLSLESIKELAGKIDKIETEIGALSQRADSTAFVGEGLKSVQEDFSAFKQNVFDKTNSIEQKIGSVSDIIKRQDTSTAEFHKKSEKLFDEMQAVKNVANKASSDSSKEMMALLKLSEYQSNIRMNAESKYGDAKVIENMASQTADMVNLFDRISIESGEKIPLPHEVRQWAVSKILDCADKWEIRFSDVYSILTNAIGRDMLKESVRIQQIRDIYGIRAVDQIRKDLNIS